MLLVQARYNLHVLIELKNISGKTSKKGGENGMSLVKQRLGHVNQRPEMHDIAIVQPRKHFSVDFLGFASAAHSRVPMAVVHSK